MKDIFYDLTISIDVETFKTVHELFRDNEKDYPSLSMMSISNIGILNNPVELTITGCTTQEDLIQFLEKSIRR